MNLPEELKYSKDHEWVRMEGDMAVIGVTDHAQNELGDIVFIDIDTQGQDLAQGDVFGNIEAVKTVSDLFMPVSGHVAEVNPALEDAPEAVNKDPYGEGWLIKVKVADASQVDGLLSAAQYKELVA